MQENQSVEKEDVKNVQKQEKKTKKMKTRAILVLIFIAIIALFAYISYRGNYLEALEIGENFKQVFTEDLKYQYAIIGANFIFVYIIVTYLMQT